ncbi:MAG TPA: 8-amino-7-oxononanoate synthase [Gemmatimonadaceae bacterium]
MSQNPLGTASPSLVDALTAELESLRDRDLERQLRPVSGRRGAVLQTERGSVVDFASNDYLGLASDPRLMGDASIATSRVGIGAAASRLIAGDTVEHEKLDRALAEFFNAEAALSFSSGYSANVGIIPALVGRDDVIFADELNHASLIDGCRLSRATVHVYPHADTNALAQLFDHERAKHRRALIVTDGMFSMDGDLAPLNDIVPLARKHNAWTYVDDAHGVGVHGENGRGTIEELGLEGQIDITVGTLGKAFGAAGAFVVGSTVLREFLINRARSFIFSTGPMPAQAAAARSALGVVKSEAPLRQRLRANCRYLRVALATHGVHASGTPDSQIVPIIIGDAATTVAVGLSLLEQGFLVGAVRPPTVAPGTSRLRITVSAAHTHAQIDQLVNALSTVLEFVHERSIPSS